MPERDIDWRNCRFDASAFGPLYILLRNAIADVAAIAQLGERQTEDLKVPGSIPGCGMLYYMTVLILPKTFLFAQIFLVGRVKNIGWNIYSLLTDTGPLV